MCDKSITEKGGAIVTGVIFDESATTPVTSDNPCVVTMTLKHNAGCPVIDLYRVKLVFDNNEWLVGIILIISGLFIGLCGLKYLRSIAAILVSLSIFLLILVLSNIFGFFITILGISLTFAVALVSAISCGIATLFFVWIAIGGLGVLGGFFLGSLIYEVTFMQYNFSNAWGFMGLTVTGVVLGLVLSVKYGQEVILLSTALIGGWNMMQGTCRYFPTEDRFPTEIEIVEAIYNRVLLIDMIDWKFWLYFSEWISFFIIFTVFQCLN